ncbi:TetR family transcriptional regulator [Streptomyces cellostaticus]|uniref:TetR family transcriptional regulator n=1 Tax=Streptomyces cellostaticus TaxID=67285 RepID=A0A101NPM9_9ACTN|nr:TetR/AcrR family transcriptional regulator [Streptomyces cellostaticus]KUM96811.1 TetR family transcriptional regulator [Streptomyces cellostaticus]GHI05765.1 TetR family transcriptional regulator [Streptomyces cellostaticus]
MSRKQQRGEATVEHLLDAALRVYAQTGDQGLTVSAVTKASGVSLGSLYHHFGSIDGLMNALLMRWLERLLGELVTAVQGTRTAHTGIRALVGAYLAFVQEHRDAARLLHSAYADRQGMADGKQLRDAQEARLSPLAQWAQAYVDSGELAPLPMPLIESLILGPVVGVARRWLSGINDVDLDEAALILPDRIWRSVGADPK